MSMMSAIGGPGGSPIPFPGQMPVAGFPQAQGGPFGAPSALPTFPPSMTFNNPPPTVPGLPPDLFMPGAAGQGAGHGAASMGPGAGMPPGLEGLGFGPSPAGGDGASAGDMASLEALLKQLGANPGGSADLSGAGPKEVKMPDGSVIIQNADGSIQQVGSGSGSGSGLFTLRNAVITAVVVAGVYLLKGRLFGAKANPLAELKDARQALSKGLKELKAKTGTLEESMKKEVGELYQKVRSGRTAYKQNPASADLGALKTAVNEMMEKVSAKIAAVGQTAGEAAATGAEAIIQA